MTVLFGNFFLFGFFLAERKGASTNDFGPGGRGEGGGGSNDVPSVYFLGKRSLPMNSFKPPLPYPPPSPPLLISLPPSSLPPHSGLPLTSRTSLNSRYPIKSALVVGSSPMVLILYSPTARAAKLSATYTALGWRRFTCPSESS